MSAWDPSALITGRSKRYVRASVVLLTLTLALAGSVLLFAENRHQHIQHDFQDNDRLHLVEVSSRYQDGRIEQLGFSDAAAIRAILARQVPHASYTLVERYDLGGGLIGDQDTPLTLYGLSDATNAGASAKLLGIARLEPGAGYTISGKPAPARIQVPVVNVHTTGYSSDVLANADLHLEPVIGPSRAAFVFRNPDGNVLVVDFTTFQTLAEKMLGGSWASIVARYDNGQLSLTPLVGDEYIQVKDLGDVDAVANAINAHGYNPTYALQAFDNLSGSLRSQALLGFGLVLMTILATTSFLMISWNAYFTLSRRDIGMLKHFGYSQESVRRIYARRVTTGCRNALLVVSAYVVAASLILLGGQGLAWAAVNVAALVAIVTIVRVLLVRIVLTRHVRVDVLTLLRLDRQFQ